MAVVGRRILAAVACAVGAFPLRVDAVEIDTMHFRNDCFAGAVKSCFVIAEGTLDRGAPQRFDKLPWEQIGGDTYQVLFNSPGGDLDAGLKLGRAIRARKMQTVIGSWDAIDPLKEKVDNAVCLSACAYAFLGGVNRNISKGSRIGFHQFALPGGDLFQGPAVLSRGQRQSALLISYLLEMGVDARLFSLASSADSNKMSYPTLDQLMANRVVTPKGFDHFSLEPQEKGIVAASRRLDDPRIHDEVTNLTAFCRDGVARFMLTAQPSTGIHAKMDNFGAGVSFSSSKIKPIEVIRDRIRTWATEKGGFIELSLTKTDVKRLFQAEEMTVFFDTANSEGGCYHATVRLHEMDKKMLAAAFRFCLDGISRKTLSEDDYFSGWTRAQGKSPNANADAGGCLP